MTMTMTLASCQFGATLTQALLVQFYLYVSRLLEQRETGDPIPIPLKPAPEARLVQAKTRRERLCGGSDVDAEFRMRRGLKEVDLAKHRA